MELVARVAHRVNIADQLTMDFIGMISRGKDPAGTRISNGPLLS
jgi:hypothetical protein